VKPAQKNAAADASIRIGAGISMSNATKHMREIEMTKFVSLVAAFVLFAPVAAVTLLQAAQIIA
jgi:hypothetical protein